MTDKQRHYIHFIEDMTGVIYHQGDNLVDYINKNKDEAHRKWQFQCDLESFENEDAGDR